MSVDCYLTEDDLQRCHKCYGWGHSWFECASKIAITYEEWKVYAQILEANDEEEIFEEYKRNLFYERLYLRLQSKTCETAAKVIHDNEPSACEEHQQVEILEEKSVENVQGFKVDLLSAVHVPPSEGIEHDGVFEEESEDLAYQKKHLGELGHTDLKEHVGDFFTYPWRGSLIQIQEKSSPRQHIIYEIIASLQVEECKSKDGQPRRHHGNLCARGLFPNGSYVKMDGRFKIHVFDPGGYLFHLKATL